MSTKEKKSKAQHSWQERLSKFVSFISNYILISFHFQPPSHAFRNKNFFGKNSRGEWVFLQVFPQKIKLYSVFDLQPNIHRLN